MCGELYGCHDGFFVKLLALNEVVRGKKRNNGAGPKPRRKDRGRKQNGRAGVSPGRLDKEVGFSELWNFLPDDPRMVLSGHNVNLLGIVDP